MLTKCFRDTLDYLPSNDHTLGEKKKTSLFFFFFTECKVQFEGVLANRGILLS